MNNSINMMNRCLLSALLVSLTGYLYAQNNAPGVHQNAANNLATITLVSDDDLYEVTLPRQVAEISRKIKRIIEEQQQTRIVLDVPAAHLKMIVPLMTELDKRTKELLDLRPIDAVYVKLIDDIDQKISDKIKAGELNDDQLVILFQLALYLETPVIQHALALQLTDELRANLPAEAIEAYLILINIHDEISEAVEKAKKAAAAPDGPLPSVPFVPGGQRRVPEEPSEVEGAEEISAILGEPKETESLRKAIKKLQTAQKKLNLIKKDLRHVSSSDKKNIVERLKTTIKNNDQGTKKVVEAFRAANAAKSQNITWPESRVSLMQQYTNMVNKIHNEIEQLSKRKK